MTQAFLSTPLFRPPLTVLGVGLLQRASMLAPEASQGQLRSKLTTTAECSISPFRQMLVENRRGPLDASLSHRCCCPGWLPQLPSLLTYSKCRPTQLGENEWVITD